MPVSFLLLARSVNRFFKYIVGEVSVPVDTCSSLYHITFFPFFCSRFLLGAIFHFFFLSLRVSFSLALSTLYTLFTLSFLSESFSFIYLVDLRLDSLALFHTPLWPLLLHPSLLSGCLYHCCLSLVSSDTSLYFSIPVISRTHTTRYAVPSSHSFSFLFAVPVSQCADATHPLSPHLSKTQPLLALFLSFPCQQFELFQKTGHATTLCTWRGIGGPRVRSHTRTPWRRRVFR